MRLTKEHNSIHYIPQEIKETTITEVTYLPITREMLERIFLNSVTEKKHEHKLKKRRQSLIRQQVGN